MLALLRTFSLQELRHHPWRNAAAVVAVMLGVALAFSVHLINASALSEFSSAVRSAGGQPDLEVRAVQGSFDEALYARIASHPQVSIASPVLELSTIAVAGAKPPLQLRIVGMDALVVAAVAPSLMPVPAKNADRFALFAPGQVFLNPAARLAFGDAQVVQLQNGSARVQANIAGTVTAQGSALAVMDLGAAQDFFARQGQLTRIDVRLRAGSDRASFLGSMEMPAGVVVAEPADAASRVNSLSRAYRVNLTVLALVALFTGAFLVYSVLALSVARRSQQFALLGVLGVTAPQRRRLVLAESLLLGVIGSALGIALGTALAALGLRWLGGDLGGGYFSGVAPQLQWTTPAALLYAALGIAAAAAGGWLPALAAQRLPLAQTLKGLGTGLPASRKHWLGMAMVLAGGALALLPPVQGIPLGAYLSVGLLLVGGISVLPWLIAGIYDAIAPALGAMLLPMLAVERARRVRESAAIAVSGVVASLSLAVALTVMVASFRASVSQWLDVVLPADLYSRTSTSASAGDTVFFPASFIRSVEQVPGVRRVSTQRTRPLLLDASLPAVALLARTLDDPGKALPLVGELHPAPAGQIAIYVSEAVVDLYGARPGSPFPLLEKAFPGSNARFHVAGVWRDYVRQSGAIAMSRADYERLTGDSRFNDFQLWLETGADPAKVQGAIRELAQREAGLGGIVEFASAQELRAVSLRIFDRSFAVTYWLQAVAIGIGLFGVAASFSAQVLARRKEFGLLSHLGLTRRQILGVVAGEGAAWTVIGSIAGLVLGLAVAVVLVHVVNPQSFHWTMDLLVPWIRLLALCAAVIAAGTITAWLAGRAAAGRDAVLAVKEDW
ncbi:FtsX-like permease family protein [Caenimonas sp. SL110]|uniref:FtsX-like permease family protein n=1 Tax=Caenimonas sp. SL110 TaxID=1450524 RepID=UPI000653AFEB|nr:FtsX family ABC transporter permease [Caenimonas sp. SL110]